MEKWLLQGDIKMYKLMIFGGTSEGRKLVEYFSAFPVEIHVFVATEYGEEVLEPYKNCEIYQGRLTSTEMEGKITQEGYDFVIDATHPYAFVVTETVKSVCEKLGKPYFRVLRQTFQAQGVHYVNSTEEAISFLNDTYGNIFLSTGSKELEKFTNLKNFTQRVFVRVLPSVEVMEQCKRYGLTGKHMICMQGPFSEEMNIAQFLHTNATYLVTKESGKAGGFLEKINAAQKAGLQTIVIGRKKETEGFFVQTLISYLCKKMDLSPKRKVTLVGIGMGQDTLTQEAISVIQKADIIIGAKRMVDALASFQKESFISYQSKEILDFLEKNPQYLRVVVAFSGDTGFFSGAKKLIDTIQGNHDVEIVCGISSFSYFMAKLQIPWEDVLVISLHGKEEPISSYVRAYEKCFVLLGKGGVHKLCQGLCNTGLNKVEISVGERLSYPNERILKGTPEELLQEEFDDLSVAFIWNHSVKKQKQSLGIADKCFIRGKVPMTKREVRTISLSYLDLQDRDIVYDIGAGTGSVSIEVALQCPFGKVYAIEKKEEAISLLQGNQEKFDAWNVAIMKGEAPHILEELPAPDKVFIGGSSGNMEEILSCILQKNPNVLVVINVIALETLSETLALFQKMGFIETEYMQIAVSKAEKVGKYHLMKGQNPVYIIKGRGNGNDDLS